MISFLILLICLGFSLYCQNINGFEYTSKNGTITITGYNGSARSIVVPGKINGLPVETIGHEAFDSKTLTSVSLPNSVKRIDSGAFYNNQLSNLILPDSLNFIGDAAFAYNRLTGIVIPHSVTSIGSKAFYGNDLELITIPRYVSLKPDSFYLVVYDNYTRSGREGAVFSISTVSTSEYKTAILNNSEVEILEQYQRNRTAVIPAKINGLPVVAIGERAFSKSNLTGVLIPDTVRIIGEEAFTNNKIDSVVIPDSVTTICDGAFINNQINSVTLGESLTSIGNAAFTSNKLTNIILPDHLSSIGFSAFTSNQLTTVIVPASVKFMKENVFDSDVKIRKTAVHASATEHDHSYFSYN